MFNLIFSSNYVYFFFINLLKNVAIQIMKEEEVYSEKYTLFLRLR